MYDQYHRQIYYVRLSVTDRCNLRCRYCMPEDVKTEPREDILRYEEYLQILQGLSELGIRHVRVTGGEPLVRRDVEQFLRQIKRIPGMQRVTITTNGTLLKEKLHGIMAAGVDAVNVSLDTLEEKRYTAITGKNMLAQVLAGIEACVEQKLPVKINAVPQAGQTVEELAELVKYGAHMGIPVRFIELMPIGYGRNVERYPYERLAGQLQSFFPGMERLEQGVVQGDGPAVYYGLPEGIAVGFISALHGKFCESCNRVRITSEGFLKTCLASGAGCDLRKILRSNSADQPGEQMRILREQMRNAIWKKPAEHHFERGEAQESREMFQIGG